MSKKITARKLQASGACSEQVKKFKEIFPEGTEITEALCIQHAQTFDWGWAAENLLTPRARKVYGEAHAVAWKVYDEAHAVARKVYDEAHAVAFARAYLSPENQTAES